jgi:siroheme decarboxylase
MLRNNRELKIGRLIQRDLAMTRRPYQEMADQTGQTEQEAIEMIAEMMARGWIRKFGAIVRHQKAGFTRNAMIVWAVPKDRCEQVGRVLSSFGEITHCYERSPAFLGKYNLFSMIHLKDRAEEKLIEKIAAATGIEDYQVLASEEEFKKSSMEYFA